MMEVNGYKLSERAALAAMGYQTKPKVPMTISAQAVAQSRTKPAPTTSDLSPMAMDAKAIFSPPALPEGVLPDGMVAMDSCMPVGYGSISTWAMSGLYHEGQGFFGYPYLAELQQRAEYRHAAEIWAEHAVRKWIKLTGGTDAQRKAIEEEMKRLNVRDVFQEWIGHDHIFGRGQIFLDFGDADKEDEVATELLLTKEKIGKKRPLQRLTVVEPMWTSPGTYSTSNPLRWDFYSPQQWFVYGRRVHNSRFLTIIGRPVSDMLKPSYNFGGQSLIQLMKPYVDNWLRTRQAISDMVNAYSVFVLKTDMSMLFTGGASDDLYRRLDFFNQTRDNRGSMMIDKNEEELENIAVTLAGLADLQAQAQEQLASVSRIPLSIYLQVTPTGLNASSEGETRSFYADVKAYNEKNVRPHLDRLLQIIQLSLFGAIVPDLNFEFLPLWEMNDKDKSDIRKADADADIGYVTSGIISPEEVRERLSNDETSMYHGVDLTDPPPDMGNDDDDQDVTAEE